MWFRLLCKDVAVKANQIVHPQSNEGDTDSHDETRNAAQRQSQANFIWLKPGFVLKMSNLGKKNPVRTKSSASDSTLAAPSIQAQVELFCFGAPIALKSRFHELVKVSSCDEIMQDPYILLEIVFEEMYRVLDRAGWIVADIFGAIETVKQSSLTLNRHNANESLENTCNGKQARKGDQGTTQRSFHGPPQPRKAHHLFA